MLSKAIAAGIILAVAFLFVFADKKAQPGESLKSPGREYRQIVKTAESKWQEGEFHEAFSLFSQGLDLARKMNDGQKETRCLISLGKLCWPLGRPEESERFYAEALEKASVLSLSEEKGECLGALKVLELYSEGKADRLKGQLEKSSADFRSALEWARKISSAEHEVKCLRQLSLTYWAKQDQGSFLSLNINALQIASRSNDRREQVKCRSNIGMYFLWHKDYVEALDNYSQALELAREISSREDESICLKNISLVLMNLGFYEKSVGFLEAANEIDRQSGNSYLLSQSLNNLGDAYRNRGILLSNKVDLWRALDYFCKALDLAKENPAQKTEMRILNNIGNVYIELEKYHTALHYLYLTDSIAEKVRDDRATPRILINIGICHLKEGNHERARPYFQKAVEMEGNASGSSILWEALYFLGQCSEMEKDYNQAMAYYENSLEAIDQTRVRILLDDFKAGFMRNKFRVYESLISLLFRLHENEPSSALAKDIFYVVERAKARAFLETMGEIQESPGSRVISDVPKEKPEDLSSKAAASQDTKSSVTEKKAKETFFEQPDEKDRLADKAFPQPVRLEKVQDQLLDEKTAILEYFLGDDQSLLFVITKNDFTLLTLPPKEEIRKSLAAYLILLSKPPRGDWDWHKAASRLSKDLVGPALQSLPGPVEHVIVVPDDILCHLPFETLTFASDDGPSQDKLLIAKYAISYAPSCSSLLLLKEKKPTRAFPKSLLAFGNPVYPSKISKEKTRITVAEIAQEMVEEQGYDLYPLEDSKKEVKLVSHHFPEEKRDIYLGKNATEEKLKQSPLEDYQVIHFACHGLLDEKVPFRSGLFLSLQESRNEDGFLQASEIAGLKLAADLVVLSACRTSRGYLEKGEGVMGLTRTFFFSGASSVVSTLWKISDRAAVEFMKHFYDYLAQGKDKAQALRLTKLRLLESRYSHPFFWSAFVLHGESASALSFR